MMSHCVFVDVDSFRIEKVTVGSASLKWSSTGGSGEVNFWADSALIAAAGCGVGNLLVVHVRVPRTKAPKL